MEKYSLKFWIFRSWWRSGEYHTNDTIHLKKKWKSTTIRTNILTKKWIFCLQSEIVESRKLDRYDVNGPRVGSKESQVKDGNHNSDNAYNTVLVALHWNYCSIIATMTIATTDISNTFLFFVLAEVAVIILCNLKGRANTISLLCSASRQSSSQYHIKVVATMIPLFLSC